jgi:hypothetical protein
MFFSPKNTDVHPEPQESRPLNGYEGILTSY